MQNPALRRKSRNIRIAYAIAALFALFVSTYHILDATVFHAISNDQCVWVPPDPGRRGLVIRDVIPGGVTDLAGIIDGDTLLQINGTKIDLFNAGPILNAMNAGDTATYLVASGQRQFEARIRIVKLVDVFNVSLFILGLAFLVVGMIVVLSRPEGLIQRKFGQYGIVCLLVFGLFALAPDPAQPAWWRWLFILPFMAGRALAPAILIGFFLQFPTRLRLLDRRWVMPSLYALGIAIVLLLVFRIRLAIGQTFALYLLGSPIFIFVTGLFFFVVQYFKSIGPAQRKQLRPVLVGVITGVVVFSYLIILSGIKQFAYFLMPVYQIPVLFITVMPLSFGYAIFRYRLMDIDLIVEKSLIYGIVTAALAAIYLGVVFGAGSLIGMIMGNPDSKILSAAALIVIAFVFDPLKRRVQGSIDRTFYRERHDYQRALLEFSQELPRFINMEQVLDSIVNRISGTMHVEKIAVILCDDREGCTSVSKNIDRDCCEFRATQNGLLEHLRLNKAAQTLYFLNEDSGGFVIDQADQEKIVRSGIVLAVPMLLQERLIGLITVGPKLSGKVYSQDDIDLLTTVASQAAIAVENSRLHRSEIEKEKIQEELELARRIQQGLLPKNNPDVAHLDIAGITIPARSVGGDYFDFITLGPGRLLVVVADVSGKGMSAALYMSKIQGMIQLAAHMYQSPKEMLVHVNRLLYEGIERRSFITMILGLFDAERKSVRICRAGHNKAIVGRNGGISVLDGAGIGLGLERGPVFEKTLQEIEYPLDPDSLVIFYSDGLSETMNENDSEFGEESICRIIETHRRQTAGQLQDQLVGAARGFRGGADQHDDITLVVVKSC